MAMNDIAAQMSAAAHRTSGDIRWLMVDGAQKIRQLEQQLAEIERRKNHSIGWMYAEACSSLDRGEDIRKINFPDIIARMNSEIEEQDNG